jgi:3-phosphoshikimate 1-carboxyvinyltransferase
MARLIEPLERMGARIEHRGSRLPVHVIGRRLGGITHRNVPASAQVKTALLLAGLQAHGITRIIEPEPSRAHGEVLLGRFGCRLETCSFGDSQAVSLSGPQELRPARIDIGGDPSSAAFPIVAALIVPGSSICVESMLATPARTGLIDVLCAMGADLRLQARETLGGEALASVICRHSRLEAVEVPASLAPAMIDEYPVAAVAASFATGTTVFRGLAELRHKESDRLERLVSCLKACGVIATEKDNDLFIAGRRQPARSVDICSHGDHRIAMAFAVMGLAGFERLIIDRADMIGTSFPGFADMMGSLGARLECVP